MPFDRHKRTVEMIPSSSIQARINRPTLFITLTSLSQVRLSAIPCLAILLWYLGSQGLHTLVQGIKEFESDIKILGNVDVVGKKLFGVALFHGFGRLITQSHMIVEICLDSDSEANIDIAREWETAIRLAISVNSMRLY